MSFNSSYGQTKNELKGKVNDEYGYPLEGAIVSLDSIKSTQTNENGVYTFNGLENRTYLLTIKYLGYKLITQQVTPSDNPLTINMEEEAIELAGVTVVSEKKDEKTEVENSGFNVEAVETKELRNQSIPLNQVMDQTVGVRVRQSGGMGSEYVYSLDGMSGNSIRFFLDGIPMDYYGSSYTINNLPISLIDRIDVYKGVVPVDLGSDALGGAINIVTDTRPYNFVEGAYSYGPYNTHQASLQSQWIDTTSFFTTRVSTFYNYSDNNYKVWGPGVNYGDASTGFQTVEFTEDNPAERFNDDFRTANIKLDLGFIEKKWADKFFFSIIGSDLKRGVQTGRNMSQVYGRVRYNEQFIMPSIAYTKENLLTYGLNLNVFTGYSITDGILIDTSGAQYDWRGDSIGYNANSGEISYDDGKSEFSLLDKSWITRFNLTYQFLEDYKIGLNYVGSGTQRTGTDPFSPEYRIPYLYPQSIASQFAGLSLSTVKFDKKLNANAFVKFYHFDALINDYEWQVDDFVILEHQKSITNWGGGFAASYRVLPRLLTKFSLEQATRMPNATEALGNGIAIQNNPDIEPETSFNINLGATLGRYQLGKKHGFKVSGSTFYRDTENLLLFTVTDALGNGQYQNVNKTKGKGVELDIVYDYVKKFKVVANGTYLDIRNNLEYELDGRENIVYQDRLRNTPYLMANAGLQLHLDNVIQQKSKMMFYYQLGYVHQFFLNWPSLGAEDGKRFIPTQLTSDIGTSYTLPSGNLSFAVDVTNIFNEQVFDNYLLQKPGRAIFFKINYQLKSKTNK